MKKLLATILIILITTSCSILEKVEDAPVDPNLAKYLTDFEQYYKLPPIKNIPLNYTNVDTPYLGVCILRPKFVIKNNIVTTTMMPSITINKKQFSKLSSIQKKLTIFHELGHCYFYILQHDTAFIQLKGQRCPRSIMFPYIFNDELINKCYIKNEDYYLKELESNRMQFKITKNIRIHINNIDLQEYINQTKQIIEQCNTTIKAKDNTINKCLQYIEKSKEQNKACMNTVKNCNAIVNDYEKQLSIWYRDPKLMLPLGFILGMITGIGIIL